MITAILFLAVVVLTIKVFLDTRRMGGFDDRFNLLDRQLANLEQKLKKLQNAAKPSSETVEEKSAPPTPAPDRRAPQERPPVMAAAPPVQPQPKLETRPIIEEKIVTHEAPPEQPPAAPPSPPAIPPTPSWSMPKFDWESLVGVKLFSWIAGVALLIAAIAFLRYSKAQGWLTPPVQMAIGVIVGIILLVLCELKAARKYPITANAMDASAIAILFSTFFAARALWNLIGAIPAFILMVLVTAVAVLLSIRRESLFIALLGLVGGFATPALLSTGENKPISLFTYILLLNAGLAWVATKKKWPLLTTLSLVFTVLYQWGWVMKFLTASQLPIALGIFLAFPVLAFAALALGQKEDPAKGWLSLYGQSANLCALLPLLFALYMAAVPGYGHRYALLFGFLFLLDAGLLAIAAARGHELLHFLGGVSTIIVWAIWLGFSYESDAWPAVLGFILLFAIFYMAAPFIARRFDRKLAGIGKYAVYTAPLLLFVLPCLASMEPACASPALLFGTLFLIMLGASAYAIHSEEGVIYYIAAIFALLAETVWSLKYLTPDRLYSGLLLYAVFGLFYIGVPIAAQRRHKKLRPESAGAGLLLVSLALLFFLAVGPIASISIWGLALLLLILNAGLFWQGSACRLPMLAIAGMVLSWIILGVLWASVSLAAILMPALVVMAGFACLVLAGSIWMQKKASGAEAAVLGKGLSLGLTGHIFLIAVAVQPSLSVPPWPLLGILLVLDIAISGAALYARRSDLHQQAIGMSALILMVWAINAGVAAPWPRIAIFAAGALILYAFLWIRPAKRAGIDAARFPRATEITIILCQLVVFIAAAQPGSPGIGFLLATHMIFLIAFLALEWFSGTNAFAAIAMIAAEAAVSVWCLRHSGSEFWPQQLLFAVPIYLVFIAYPILLGSRAGRSLLPCLTAVLAGIPFFFQARHAIIQAGWGQAIGILPVAQAFLMALLLMRLLNIEPRGARSMGRLALTAGAGLAFVTVAIPLQLEKEWITIGWALEGTALAWLFRRIPHKGLLFATFGLFTAVFIRLAVNPYVLIYQPRGGTRIWNWYLYTYLVSAAATISGGWLLSKAKHLLSKEWLQISKVLPAGGVVLLFLLLNIEIADFYSIGQTITFNFTATLAQDLTYTLGWALFAVALLAAGIWIRSQAARISALALLVITILKCFIHDLARLGGLYLVASCFGLALCLALVALVLQKYVLSARKEAK